MEAVDEQLERFLSKYNDSAERSPISLIIF